MKQASKMSLALFVILLAILTNNVANRQINHGMITVDDGVIQLFLNKFQITGPTLWVEATVFGNTRKVTPVQLDVSSVNPAWDGLAGYNVVLAPSNGHRAYWLISGDKMVAVATIRYFGGNKAEVISFTQYR